MSSYKSFAIVGFGTVGTLAIKALLESFEPSNLRILTRSKTLQTEEKELQELAAKETLQGVEYVTPKSIQADRKELQDLAAKGVIIKAVDYTSQKSLIDALKGVEVVLSGLRNEGLDSQANIIHASKAASVKLFIPSEYGRNTIGDTTVYLKAKSDTHQLLKELGLPYTLFFTGLWPEVAKSPLGVKLGLDFEAGKFKLFGGGRKTASWTSPIDFVPFIIRIITTLSPSELENKNFEIQGDKKSFRDLVDIWEKKHGRKAEVKELSEEETQKFIDTAPSEVLRFMPRQWADGGLQLSGEANKLWPEWNPANSKWELIMP